MKRLALAAAAVLLAACYHDNASPFRHGSHNAPRKGGTTKTSAAGPSGTDANSTAYGQSSGAAGGVMKK